MIAHAKAVEVFRTYNIAGGKIGIILNLTPSYPRSEHPADVKASRITDLFFNRSFLDPSGLGEYPQELIELLREHGHLPVTEKDDQALLVAGKGERLGGEYYQPHPGKAGHKLPHPHPALAPDRVFGQH